MLNFFNDTITLLFDTNGGGNDEHLQNTNISGNNSELWLLMDNLTNTSFLINTSFVNEKNDKLETIAICTGLRSNSNKLAKGFRFGTTKKNTHDSDERVNVYGMSRGNCHTNISPSTLKEVYSGKYGILSTTLPESYGSYIPIDNLGQYKSFVFSFNVKHKGSVKIPQFSELQIYG